jgi:hypothetical protein
MDRLRLDQASQKAKNLSWTLFLASMGGLAFVPAAVRVLNGPSWAVLLAALLPFVGIGLALALARKVQCPSCTRPMLYKFAPTWVKPPRPSRERGVMECPHCLEEIDVSGGTSPPSNISLDRP